jgi:hypothetical protein
MRSDRPVSRHIVPLVATIMATAVLIAVTPDLAAAEVSPVGDVPERIFPGVDLAAAALEDAEDEAAGRPPRFAIPNRTHISPDTHGIWEEDGGMAVWRMKISSLGAHSLNLGFGSFHMPEGGRLHIYSPDLVRSIRPFTDRDNAAHGELWTPVLPGESLVLEVTVPSEVRHELRLELTSVNVGYRGFGKEDPTESGWCNIDVVCPEGDGWRDEIPSVAVISRGGSRNCTGFMVNNTAQDRKPYFMTAKHCGVDQSNAASLVAYWNYETSVCGGTPDGSLDQFNTGSFWRSAYTPSDFTLVELDEDPDPSYGVTFAGWDRSGADATSAVAIHHPSVDEKRISFEYDATTTTSYLGYSVPGDGTHVRVIDWDEGTTEGGSSGSPLFDQDHRVIGQLHGGYAACGNDSSDWYGKFSVSWNGGGTSTTRLRDWLDPGNTGATTVNTLVPGQGCTGNEDCDDGEFCNGAETCETGSCVPGSDPCPGQECDEDADVCITPGCNNNGVCDPGEDCTGCPADCISGASGGTCGDGICETGAGEDCVSCSADCNGVTGGKPSRRYCCGDGDGGNPVDCSDPRCHEDGNTCSTGGGGVSYCCGDGSCEGEEDGFNCEVDCGSPPTCGDLVCNSGAGEDQCTCPADCGAPPADETGACSDGIDNDCDGLTDTEDGDCIGDCLPIGASCTVDEDCCSYKCLGAAGKKVCK